MDKFYYKAPIGILEIICNNNKLISLKLVGKPETSCNKTNIIKNITQQLDEYFLGERQVFDIEIAPNGTGFQKQVWQELQKIPYGKTCSYSEIAENINNKNAQRAVGSACNKNPIIIIIPCHRIISKNGNIGGFAYGNSIKRKLLGIENNANIKTDRKNYLTTLNNNN